MTEPLNRGWCGTMPVHRRLLDSAPGYAAARTAIETFTFAQAALGLHREGVITIPVVVHVVANTDEQDISVEQVTSQIDVLTADFRAQNADVDQVPGPWVGLVGDTQVEFTLATEAPDGEPTTGITRTRTDVPAFDTGDTVKSALTGGADAWPTDQYLNIWVCPLQGGLLGYAQFPGGPPETDGVVINYQAFGTSGTAAAPFDLGRTATHEVGHWLNLRHIWGDDGDGCGGDDLVADTPNAAGPNFGAPTFPKVSCSNGPNGDMFMNYMDYTDDVAMFMFTSGQVGRMAACLAGPRNSFLTLAAA